MRIFFNKNHEKCLEVIRMLSQNIAEIKNIRDSSIEDSWSFSFVGHDFFIFYDANSLKNKLIPEFTISSYACDAGEENDGTLSATRSLYNEIKKSGHVTNLFVEED